MVIVNIGYYGSPIYVYKAVKMLKQKTCRQKLHQVVDTDNVRLNQFSFTFFWGLCNEKTQYHWWDFAYNHYSNIAVLKGCCTPPVSTWGINSW